MRNEEGMKRKNEREDENKHSSDCWEIAIRFRKRCQLIGIESEPQQFLESTKACRNRSELVGVQLTECLMIECE